MHVKYRIKIKALLYIVIASSLIMYMIVIMKKSENFNKISQQYKLKYDHYLFLAAEVEPDIARHKANAERHRKMADQIRDTIRSGRSQDPSDGVQATAESRLAIIEEKAVTEFSKLRETYLRACKYNEMLTLKYKHASNYPWLRIDPDPPEPTWDFLKPRAPDLIPSLPDDAG